MTFRPRFSLRTLCVFLLLVTSGVGLWWHWEPWYCVRSVNEHTGPVYRAQFSRDCMRVLTHSEGEEPLARVWDGETGQMLAAMERSACYTDCAAAFSHDGTRLLTAGLDRTARVLEIPGGRQIAGAPL